MRRESKLVPSAQNPGQVYDPRTYGAQCDRCLLGPARGHKYNLREGSWQPVAFEMQAGATALAIGQCPATEEVARGFPLAGPSGNVWHDVLKGAGLTRPEIALTNVIKCQPEGKPGGAYDRMETRLKSLRKLRASELVATGAASSTAAARAMAEQELPHPADCCRPALLWEVSGFRNLLPLGRTAAEAVVSEARGRGIKKLHGVRFDVRAGELEGELGAMVGTPGVPPPWLAHTTGAREGHRVLATVHPAFAARTRSWLDEMVVDLGRAWRWWNDRLGWVDPVINIDPTLQDVRDFLRTPKQWRTYDTETTGIDPLTADCQCIGFADPPSPGTGARRCLVIPLVGLDGSGRYYTPEIERLILWEVCTYLADPRRGWKIGHNIVQYDNPLLRRLFERAFGREQLQAHLGFRWEVINAVDTLPLARLAGPDRPRSLGACGQRWTDVNDWKTDQKGHKLATLAGLDPTKLRYCGVDCQVNADIYPPLRAEAATMGAFEPLRSDMRPSTWPSGRPWCQYELDMDAARFCAELHEVGMFVDQAERTKQMAHYEVQAAKLRGTLVAIARDLGVKLDDDGLEAEASDEIEGAIAQGDWGRAGIEERPINPNSFDQVGDLIYGKWRLPVPDGVVSIDDGAWGKVEGYTASGRPSTADPILRALLVLGTLTPAQEKFIRFLRLFRRYKNKVIGTLLRPLEPGRLVWRSDGRVHASWNGCGVAPGRLSCSSPNLQNVSARKGMGHLRRVFGPEPEGHRKRGGKRHIYIIFDYDQIHLRLIANYARIPSLLRAFLGGEDAHVLHALMLFEADLARMDGWGPEGFSTYRKPHEGSEADGARSFAKSHIYASAYWAQPETKARVLQSMETKPGVMPYLRRSLGEVEGFHRRWLGNEPEWPDNFWMPALRACEANGGRAVSAVFGRKSPVFRALRGDGKPGADVNDAVNWPMLAGERDIVSIAEHRLRRVFFPEFDGPGTGIVNQKHDEMTIEAEDRGPEGNDRLCAEVTALATVVVPGAPVEYTAKAGWSYAWK